MTRSKRRLAGAVLADDGVHLAGAQVEVDAVERRGRAVAHDDAVNLEERRHLGDY